LYRANSDFYYSQHLTIQWQSGRAGTFKLDGRYRLCNVKYSASLIKSIPMIFPNLFSTFGV